MPSTDQRAKWKADPVAFIEGVLIDPETGKPFVLYQAQKAFLRTAFKLTTDGRLVHSEQLFSAPKKSGKTALAAMAMIYVIVGLGGPYAEGYCCANDFEQAQGRVFQAVVRIIEKSPLLQHSVRIMANKV